MNNDSADSALIETKVLYIEDDRALITLMDDIFSGFLPYKLMHCMNGEEGLEIAKAELPALILVDINMEGLNGYEVLERVREISDLDKTPVFAITGDVTPEQIEKAQAAGFSKYITKPFDVVELIAAVKECLE